MNYAAALSERFADAFFSFREIFVRDARIAVRNTDVLPNRNLVEWQQANPVAGKATLVAGCGLGDDADYLSRAGATVSAFDIAPTAIEWARCRFPTTRFFTADLLALPAENHRSYDLVVEICTLQVLPESLRAPALEALAECLAPHGDLLIVCRGRDDGEPFGALQWGVSRGELSRLEGLGLHCMSFEDYSDRSAGSRQFRAVYRRLENGL